jgi:hypothetical protein
MGFYPFILKSNLTSSFFAVFTGFELISVHNFSKSLIKSSCLSNPINPRMKLSPK